MKRTLITVISFLVLGIALAAPVAAAPPSRRTPVVSKRQQHQQRVIARGIRAGRLTPREVIHLERTQQRIQRHKKLAGADGVVTRRERIRLQRELNRSQRQITRSLSNRRRAW